MKIPAQRASRIALVFLSALLGASPPGPALAENAVEIPALAAKGNSRDDLGAFSVTLIWWDQKSEPNPVTLKWGRALVNSWQYGGVRPGRQIQNTTQGAFQYAIQRTPRVSHTGTVGIQAVAYRATSMDGPSASAVMAIGFIALFKGDALQRGVAMTGALLPGGRIGSVGGLPGKIRAAAREGYHTILVPPGQLSDPRWQLTSLALELNVTVKEVRTVDEAYEVMTGSPI